MGYWGDIHARAWLETRELLRLDQKGRVFLYLMGAVLPPVILVLAERTLEAAIRGLAVAGAFLIAGLALYLFKMSVGPARAQRKTAEIHRKEIGRIEAAHKDQIGALEAKLVAALNPPEPRDAATSLYQNQRSVARVVSSFSPKPKWLTFELEDSGAFDPALPFWYGDSLYGVAKWRARIGMDIRDGQVRQGVMEGVEAVLIGDAASLKRF